MAINPNELRLGNKLLVNGLHGENVVMTLSSITGKGTFSDDKRVLFFQEDKEQVGEFAMHCEGIPLTDKWFKKIGFDYTDKTNGGYERAMLHGVVLLDKKLYHGNGFFFSKQIEFVHQLQNLYFALTKTELLNTRHG